MASKQKGKSANEKKSTAKITDFYISPIKSKENDLQGTQLDEEPDLNDSLKSSSVLLTPDASPSKDKDLSNSGSNANNNNNYDNLTAKLLQGITPSKESHLNGDNFENLEFVRNKTTNDPSSPKSKETAHTSQHGTHLPCEDMKIKNGLPSPLQTSHNSDTSSHPKKRRGRKGRVKSAVSDVKVKTETPTKPKTSRKKKADSGVSDNKTITDFFPVRRSGRKCQSELKKEKQNEYEDKVLSLCEDGLEVVELNGKGRGVIATKLFKKGDFVVEYAGDLIDLAESKDREMFYGMNSQYGCYMYYFTLKNKQYCIDATAESGKLGRLLNHSRNGNCCTKLIEIKDRPYLILIASRDITKGEELLYDYGDRSKESLEAHPWLKL